MNKIVVLTSLAALFFFSIDLVMLLLKWSQWATFTWLIPGSKYNPSCLWIWRVVLLVLLAGAITFLALAVIRRSQGTNGTLAIISSALVVVWTAVYRFAPGFYFVLSSQPDPYDPYGREFATQVQTGRTELQNFGFFEALWRNLFDPKIGWGIFVFAAIAAMLVVTTILRLRRLEDVGNGP
jgi:hypothetical protein